MDSGPKDESKPSEAEFTSLWAENREALKIHVSRRLANASLVDDVLQEVSLTLWSKFSSFKAGTNFLAWAKAVAHFKVLRACYDQKRTPAATTPELLDLMQPEPEPFASEVEERVERLKFCLEKLKEEDRELILMRYQKKIEGKKIAEQTQKRANYIYKRIGLVRQILHRCIKRQIPFHS